MKPELLLPVGNTESFFAAVEGGADAVYFGLKDFNARNRAKNFSPAQMLSLLKEAEKRKIKTYLTLNTLIKNAELPAFLDVLHLVSQTSLTAVIIQDLGALYLLRKFFSRLSVHASTQMGIHNSLGTDFAEEAGFARVILARELTWNELQKIAQKAKSQLEIFIHGALCYSFSGMCLFSSYLGGMSANRGLCRQPCRRSFLVGNTEKYIFSLKDNQLIDYIPALRELNIHSFKIEGRMKSAEYVYQSARAYRMVIDHPEKIEKAKKILRYDLGRQKTSYFPGGEISAAITDEPFTGILIGVIDELEETGFTFDSTFELEPGNRLRVLPQSGTDSESIRINSDNFTCLASQNVSVLRYRISSDTRDYKLNDKIFLSGLGQKKFSSKFALTGKKIQMRMPEQKKKNLLQKIGSAQTENRQLLFLRIDDLAWLSALDFSQFDHLILNLSAAGWQQIDLRSPVLLQNLPKLIIQLPKFLPENKLGFFSASIKAFHRAGITNFMLSHIAQKGFFKHEKVNLSTSEHVYVLNDAAIQFIKEQKIKYYVYPLENDYPNLCSGRDRKGVVPLHFYPELFQARMPVLPSESVFRDDKNTYRKTVRDGITSVVPELPVSLMHFRSRLQDKGFSRFLIDLSFEEPAADTCRRLLTHFHQSSAAKPSTQFNFKLGLQ